jgi:hypothetical protein
MKPHIAGLTCWILFLVPVAWTQAGESVRLLGLADRTAPTPQNPAVFGNRDEILELEIVADATQNASLRADLFQIAGSMAMPLSKRLHLRDGLAFSGASPQRVRVAMKFPEVKERAQILVHLSLFPSGPQAAAISLGDLQFEVFPSDIARELAALLKPKENEASLATIFGSGHKLRDFFATLRVPFDDGGESVPDRLDPARYYFVEPSDDHQTQDAVDRRAGVRLVVFAPNESLPLGIYAERSTAGAFIRVTLPLLDDLRTDPRAQLGLIKIIHLLSATPLPPL